MTPLLRIEGTLRSKDWYGELGGNHSFPAIHEMEWRLIGQALHRSPIGPQCCWKMLIQIVTLSIANLSQAFFKNFVKLFHSTIDLRVVWAAFMMLNHKSVE